MSSQVTLKPSNWLTRLKVNTTNIAWILSWIVEIHQWNIIFMNYHESFLIRDLIWTLHRKQNMYYHEDEVVTNDYVSWVYKLLRDLT